MDILRRSVKLYVVPEEIIPEKSAVIPATCQIPLGLLPETIRRTDDVPGPKLAVLMEWYKANLVEDGGYLVGTAALPALSLDADLWREAVALLEEALVSYQKVQGPVFLPALRADRASRHAVADFYGRLYRETTTLPVVTWQKKREEPVKVDDKAEFCSTTGNSWALDIDEHKAVLEAAKPEPEIVAEETEAL